MIKLIESVTIVTIGNPRTSEIYFWLGKLCTVSLDKLATFQKSIKVFLSVAYNALYIPHYIFLFTSKFLPNKQNELFTFFLWGLISDRTNFFLKSLGFRICSSHRRKQMGYLIWFLNDVFFKILKEKVCKNSCHDRFVYIWLPPT